METTAAQMAAYQGNAASALGSSAGGASGATTIYGDTDAARVNDFADRVYLYTFQKNKAIYDKKIQDRDKLRSLMETDEINPGVLLDKDRAFIESNYRNKIHDMLVQNPDLSSDNAKYQEFQKLMQGFKEAKAYGGVRLAAVKDLDKQIAAELDPRKKARMEAHRQQILTEDIYKMPRPFQQTLDYDPNVILPKPEPITGSTEKIVGDSVVTVTTSQTPLSRFTTDTYSAYIDNENKTVADQMDLFAQNFQEMPDTFKEQQVAMWNDKINKANTAEGLKPGDQYYVPPIKGAWVNGKYVVQETTPDLVRAQAILKNYVNAESESAKVSQLPSQIEGNKAETKKKLKEANLLIPAQAELAYAQAAKARADANKTSQEAQQQAKDAQLKDQQGSYYIQETIQAFDPRNYRGLPKLTGKGQEISWTDQNGTHTADMGGGVRGIKGTVLHFSDGAKTVTSLSPFQLQAMGKRVQIQGKTTIIPPAAVVYDDSNPKNPKMVAKYEYTVPRTVKDPDDPNGEKTITEYDKKIETLEVKPIDFLKGTIKNALGEDAAGKEGEEYTRAIIELKKRTGGSENVNGWIIPLSEQQSNNKGTSAFEKSRNFFKD
jgi:hypothetical protein